MPIIHNKLQEASANIIKSDIDESVHRPETVSYPFWASLHQTGSEIWLDSGDIEEASLLWCNEMSGLTTNNTLLNNEIQKGIYDRFIAEIKPQLADVDFQSRIHEIAFILNARHGLILSETFGCRVSVELHTDFAHDLDAILEYGKRFHDIAPDKFIVKLPFTPTGLIGARKLGEMGIPVNFTLQFSARQNLITALLARPAYSNVFLGRIGAYLSNNNLGTGTNAGEKATWSAQKIMQQSEGNKTKLIAASIRSAEQLERLAGINVLTIPIKVAKAAPDKLKQAFSPQADTTLPVEVFDHVDAQASTVEKLWKVDEHEQKFAESLATKVPETAEELVERANAFNCTDLFPHLTEKEQQEIAADGKIPIHAKWENRILKKELAIDTLLNLAGLASFSTDQAALDNRIREIIA